MNETTLLRSHVERVLQDAWDVRNVEIDVNGDYPYRWETAACWVRVRPPIDEDDSNSVEVFGFAVTGLKWSSRLMAEVHDLNASARWAKIALEGDKVVVSSVLHVAASDREALVHACKAVGIDAAHIGGVVSVVHGGTTPYRASDIAGASSE
jgi:hypothetical protein